MTPENPFTQAAGLFPGDVPRRPDGRPLRGRERSELLALQGEARSLEMEQRRLTELPESDTLATERLVAIGQRLAALHARWQELIAI
jgi:hypothetical protein